MVVHVRAGYLLARRVACVGDREVFACNEDADLARVASKDRFPDCVSCHQAAAASGVSLRLVSSRCSESLLTVLNSRMVWDSTIRPRTGQAASSCRSEGADPLRTRIAAESRLSPSP